MRQAGEDVCAFAYTVPMSPARFDTRGAAEQDDRPF